jgi:hypothetical protein
MSRIDTDITAVRDLPPGRPEPTDESVSRTWHQITRRSAAPARRTSRLLVPVMAAAVVVGLAGGGAVVFGPADAPWGFGSPSGTKTTDANLAATPAETVDALNALAGKASRGSAAATVRPGQYIYVKHDGWAASFEMANQEPGEAETGIIGRQPREWWFNPQGMVLQQQAGGGAREQTGGSISPAPTGPSFAHPTPEWLASLPTDPDELRDKLRGEMGREDAWSTDHQVWSTMQEFYLNSDLLLSPRVRAGLLRAFTGLRGLTSSEVKVDGRSLVAVRHTERESGVEILFDPETGRAVGRRDVTLSDNVTLVEPPNGPELDPGVMYQATWTQKVVSAVGER